MNLDVFSSLLLESAAVVGSEAGLREAVEAESVVEVALHEALVFVSPRAAASSQPIRRSSERLEDTRAWVLIDLPVEDQMSMWATPLQARGFSFTALTSMPLEASNGMSHASTRSRAMIVGGEPVLGSALMAIGSAIWLLEGENLTLALGDGLVFVRPTWVAVAGESFCACG